MHSGMNPGMYPNTGQQGMHPNMGQQHMTQGMHPGMMPVVLDSHWQQPNMGRGMGDMRLVPMGGMMSGTRTGMMERHAQHGELLDGAGVYQLCASLSEEEIELFDMLRKPSMTTDEVEHVHLAIKALLQRLHLEQPPVLVWNIHKDFSAQRRLRTTIQQVFEHTLPDTYDRNTFIEKCDAVVFLMLEWASKSEIGWRSLLHRRF